MNFSFNLVMTTMIAVVAMMAIYFVFKKDPIEEEVKNDEFDINNLVREIKETFNNITNTNINDLGLNKTETKKREIQKNRLNKALRRCSFGDTGEKDYVKDYIKDLLLRHFNINETTINQVIKFEEGDLNIQDKFEILLYVYKKESGGNAFEEMITVHNIKIEKETEYGIIYEINNLDIDKAYAEKRIKLNYADKLEIVAQRIYQYYKGLGVIDELRDQSCLDGVSGGVSGLTKEEYNYMEEVLQNGSIKKGVMRHDSVWIFFHGQSIHLSFLSFGSKRELERVCKNVYRYDAPYYLSGIKGYVVAEDQKGSRIVVARPPFTESWKFFIRKFESIKKITIEELIKDEGCENAIAVMKYIVMGCMVIVITGNQATGKTTLLKALVRFIDSTFNIRVEEEVFETWLDKIYTGRNISSFRKTDSISMEEGMDFQKKTDGDVMIMGEVAAQGDAALLVQLSEYTRQTICTNHADTTPKLIEYFRNATLAANIFSNESVAEEQVASAMQFDIHLKKTKKGHRYIERITEIIPITEEEFPDDIGLKEGILLFCKKMSRHRMYKTSDIVRFENGQYVIKNKLSDRSLIKMRENLSENEMPEFEKFLEEKFNIFNGKQKSIVQQIGV